LNIQNASQNQGFPSEHGEVVFELFGKAAGGSLAHSLAQIVIPPGKTSLKHYHPVAEESYYILSGSAQMELEGDARPLGPGDSVIILPGQVHRITNASDSNVVLLAVCVPPWTPDCSVVVD